MRALLLAGLLLVMGCQRPGGPPTPGQDYTPSTGKEWRTITARDSSFTVQVPEMSESRFKPDSAGPGFYQMQFMRMADRRSACLFNVSWEAAGSHPDLKRRITQLAKGKELLSQKEIELEGRKGLEATIVERSAQGGLLVIRLFPGVERVYTVSFLIQPAPPKDQEKPILDQGKVFLDSFQPNLQRKPLEDPVPALEWKQYQAEDKSFTCMLPASFQGAARGVEFHGGSLLPGRAFRIDWRKSKEGMAKLKARLKKVKGVLSQRNVTRGALKGIEFKATGSIYPQSPNGEVYWLVLLGKDREYMAIVQGCTGDKTLEADARKVFDSFKPAR